MLHICCYKRSADYFFGNNMPVQQPSEQTPLSYNDIKDILSQNQSLKAQLQSMKTKCAQVLPVQLV
jgi:hypothetical protein